MSSDPRAHVLACSLLIGLCIATVSSAKAPKRATGTEPVVESYQSVEIAPLNQRVETAVSAGESWPRSPLRMTLELFGSDDETRSVRIDEVKNRGEGADTTTVTLVRDGFLNDSVRGSWERITFHRLSDGSWRVVEARRATRCWRGDRVEAYGATPCP